MKRGTINTKGRAWPLCRLHRCTPRRVWRDWNYCLRHGWHPDGAS